ncbi:DUF262 domain-containing protein [Methylobacterium sp. E-045]|uniref:GmrSD restriction endonuclease domain-containing protein n=1 Tax=Methylobacterium sp. E-045 TaxID=2836575 RepID=UPI001FBB1B8D|nr:DUF262 domain-containing protein [Methylobacterium sp. E-045]MCJ2131182.1 DUF262 domain-containing protein [Methylobacterium sp. E-045]
MQISLALSNIEHQNLVLPEFQREYVWTIEQAKVLIGSLMRGWPVGGLLLWSTANPPELKNVSVLPNQIGTVQVLLDGQQRLTTLYMLLTGEIPRYYRPEEITNDPRQLFINLDNGDLQYYQSKMSGDLKWRSVTSCFKEAINVFEIADKVAPEAAEKLAAASRFNETLNKLKSIANIDLPVQTVPPTASLTEAITIFDRVNSQGTKLTDAELALTHVTAKWPQARRVLKKKMEELSSNGFFFNLTFMTRALTVAVTGRALFTEIHGAERSELEAGWAKLSKILDYLSNLLPAHAFINSTNELNTTNAIIPLIAFLRQQHQLRFQTADSIKHAVNWLHSALIWARYTSQTDQRLEADIGIVSREIAPWDDLRRAIQEQRGRLEVSSVDLESRGVQNPLYRAVYSLVKAHGAKDWFNGVPLSQPVGKSFSIQSHHIFPQALLRKPKDKGGAGFGSGSLSHDQLVNEIANRAFLTATSNQFSSDTSPSEYLPKVEAAFPGALAAQFIPANQDLWQIDRYEDFLKARRKLIATSLNEFLRSLITKPELPGVRPVEELVALGESFTLEFKSSWQWDTKQNVLNKSLRQSCLKTIAAFLNSEGGTLIIGVDDDGNLLGLEKDLSVQDNSTDKLQQQIIQGIIDTAGTAAAALVRIRFEKSSGKEVAILDVDPSPEPIYSKTDKGELFFCRLANTTRSLGLAEVQGYVEQHWST